MTETVNSNTTLSHNEASTLALARIRRTEGGGGEGCFDCSHPHTAESEAVLGTPTNALNKTADG